MKKLLRKKTKSALDRRMDFPSEKINMKRSLKRREMLRAVKSESLDIFSEVVHELYPMIGSESETSLEH